ncbi:hypothetical protein AVEN_104849-1 [Araneus ventricosus]|uniref:Uncharacterized protein n=1 Tax=Araneus ventricosus TaxID=182803 RepID=A0A4Y2KMD6_ARAVE|nr:hypothetical protein AVEN_104849-1 [Araneus ventricosus]
MVLFAENPQLYKISVFEFHQEGNGAHSPKEGLISSIDVIVQGGFSPESFSIPWVMRKHGRAEKRELKGAVEMTPTRIIGPPTTLINEAIFLPYHPSNEGKRLKLAVLGVKEKLADRREPPG